MSIHIITDSTSDIPQDRQQALGIEVIPLGVLFGSREYADGVDLTKDEFYRMLAESDHLPTTSQVNPDRFVQAFGPPAGRGEDVLVILISSKLSGTYQSAVMARQTLGSDRIYIVDSRNATFGLALLVEEAARQRDEGIPAAQIARSLEQLRDRIRFYAVVDTLRYLKMGGRLSSTAALLGGVLGIKPLVSIVDGEVRAVGKARGKKAAFSWVAEQLRENPPSGGFPVIFGHSNAPALMTEFIEVISAAVPVVNPRVHEIGCVIGTHGGPGCVGLAYISGSAI